jgi:hypothetical protein
MKRSRFLLRTALLACIALLACNDSSPTDEGDSIRPVVTSVTPLASAEDVAIGTTISVTFSETVDPATVTAATFTVEGPDGPIAGTVTVAGRVATFTPAAPLTELGSGYTATVTASDLAGNAIVAAYAWQFTTELVSPLYWYRLSNQLLGDEKALDIYNDPNNFCFMGNTGPSAGQRWNFTPIPGLGGHRVTNYSRDPTLSLEGSDGTGPCRLNPTGMFNGQFWLIIPVTGNAGYFRLQTMFTGEGRSLDGSAEENPHMAVTGTSTGQYWKLRRLERIG